MNFFYTSFFFMVIASSFNYANIMDERFSSQVFLEISPNNENLGYNDTCMNTNGEKNVLKIIKNNDIIFDIGANNGEWSLNANEGKQDIITYAFEPIPSIYDYLTSILKPYRAFVSPLAISSEKGTAEFIYYEGIPCLSTLHERPEIENRFNLKQTKITVMTERLDNFCEDKDITKINFLKIDTEGNEWAVLLGAERLLQKGSIEVIQFEYGGCYLDSKTTLEQVYNYLLEFGFSIFRITPSGLLHIKQWNSSLENYCYSNYLAIKN